MKMGNEWKYLVRFVLNDDEDGTKWPIGSNQGSEVVMYQEISFATQEAFAPHIKPSLRMCSCHI